MLTASVGLNSTASPAMHSALLKVNRIKPLDQLNPKKHQVIGVTTLSLYLLTCVIRPTPNLQFEDLCRFPNCEAQLIAHLKLQRLEAHFKALKSNRFTSGLANNSQQNQEGKSHRYTQEPMAK